MFVIKIDENDLEPILPKIFEQLIRQKVFQLHPNLIPNNVYSFCIDAHASHTYHAENQHPCQGCPYYLKRTRKDKTWWMHYEVIVTFVAPNGFQIPVLIQRIKGNPEWGKLSDNQLKQECERSVFPEVVQKLRKLFPRLKICLHLDALYATDPIFTLLEKLQLGYSIVRKSKVLKSVGNDCEGLKSLSEPVLNTLENSRFRINQMIYYLRCGSPKLVY